MLLPRDLKNPSDRFEVAIRNIEARLYNLEVAIYGIVGHLGNLDTGLRILSARSDYHKEHVEHALSEIKSMVEAVRHERERISGIGNRDQHQIPLILAAQMNNVSPRP